RMEMVDCARTRAQNKYGSFCDHEHPAVESATAYIFVHTSAHPLAPDRERQRLYLLLFSKRWPYLRSLLLSRGWVAPVAPYHLPLPFPRPSRVCRMCKISATFPRTL